MKDLQYTRLELIAECELAIEEFNNDITSKQEIINQNNLNIESLQQGIINFNNNITDIQAQNVQITTDIATLNTRIDKENTIINDYLNNI